MSIKKAVKNVYIMVKGTYKHEIKGSGKEFFSEVGKLTGFKKKNYKKRSVKQIKTQLGYDKFK